MQLVELNKINKSFPGVMALSDVSLSVIGGEVHGIVGENGAGKSTLIKILGGLYIPDDGEILVNGEMVKFHSPLDAKAYGITVIYQEISLVPFLTVAENIFLGNLPRRKGVLDRKRLFSEADAILEELKCPFKSKDYIGNLSAGKKQMVEIARALAFESKVIIFDEPTSSLGEEEINILFTQIERLKRNTTSIIYISHKLHEIFSITDRITVMRDGRKIDTVATKETTEERIVEMMIGRNIDKYYVKLEKEIGEEALRIENYTLSGVFENISFSVRKGEILGFYGLVGAGRSELMRSIFGIDARDSGTLFINGEPFSIGHPVDAVSKGMALVPEERKEEGLILGMGVSDNLNIVKLRENNRGPFLDKRIQDRIFMEYRKKMDIKTTSGAVPVRNLSGGNQQKVVLSKWLSMNPRILILDEPTRGIDVGAKMEIHKLIVEMAKKGIAVIVISSEMSEVIGVSDRVVCMCSGRITGIFEGDEINEKNLLYAITKFSGATIEIG